MNMQQHEIISHDLAAFFAKYPLVKYSKGDTIAQAGNDLPGVLYIEKGAVEQYWRAADGRRIHLQAFRPHAFIYMSWAIRGNQNEYNFEALDEVVGRLAPREDVVAFLQTRNDILIDLLSRVFVGADRLMKRLAMHSADTAQNRLLNELLIEAERFGIPLSSTVTRIKITQSGLASRTGLARETVNRELHKLQGLSVLRLTKAGIAVNMNAITQALENE